MSVKGLEYERTNIAGGWVIVGQKNSNKLLQTDNYCRSS